MFHRHCYKRKWCRQSQHICSKQLSKHVLVVNALPSKTTAMQSTWGKGTVCSVPLRGCFFVVFFLNLHCCNVSVDNSSLHSQATNGYPAGQGDACVSSFKGNQWQLNMREMKWPRWVCLILCALVPCETEPSHHNTLSVEKRKQAAAFLQSDPHVYDRMLYSHRTSRSLSVHVLNPTPGPMPDFPSLFNTFNAVRKNVFTVPITHWASSSSN